MNVQFLSLETNSFRLCFMYCFVMDLVDSQFAIDFELYENKLGNVFVLFIFRFLEYDTFVDLSLMLVSTEALMGEYFRLEIVFFAEFL